jgi:hypothetical protein
MILLLLSAVPYLGAHYDEPTVTIEQVVESYALREDQCEYIEPEFFVIEVQAGFHPCAKTNSPNLQHLRGSRTRLLKGVASKFG